MGKLSDWAARRGSKQTVSPLDQAQRPVTTVIHGARTPAQPSSGIITSPHAPHPRPFVAMVQPAVQYPALHVPQVRARSTCAVMRPLGNEPYERLLEQLPDLATANLADVDAMSLSGRPDEGIMMKWTDSSKPRYGAPINQSPTSFEEHVRNKYQVDVGKIRSDAKNG